MCDVEQVIQAGYFKIYFKIYNSLFNSAFICCSNFSSSTKALLVDIRTDDGAARTEEEERRGWWYFWSVIKICLRSRNDKAIRGRENWLGYQPHLILIWARKSFKIPLNLKLHWFSNFVFVITLQITQKYAEWYRKVLRRVLKTVQAWHI